MVRTLLFSLQYIRYLYVNVFIYACFWYLLLLKYIIIITKQYTVELTQTFNKIH
jgi:hypothetical protein